MDLVAKRLGMDPAEFRRMNVLHDGDVTPVGDTIHYIRAEETLLKAVQESGYKKPRAKNVGRGLSLVEWTVNGGEGTIDLIIDEKGEIALASAMLDQGVGTYTVMCEVAGQELQVPAGEIKIRSLDTKSGVKNSGIGGSRGTRVFGNATYDGVLKAKEEILKIASERMGVNRDELIFSNGGVLHGRSERKLTYAEIVKAKGSPIRVQGYYNDNTKPHDASMCVQVAEVEVEPETGVVKLKQLTSVHNTGTVLNPLMHQGQIEGGAMMGIGYALMEHLMVEDGKVLTANFGDYKIPTIQDIPIFKTSVTEMPKGPGPYNSMAIGETANIPTAAAIANAVEDAVGVRIKELPITAEKVLAALKGS
jgi:CO/xanthine dehydrogenase Mo-binding subunit